MNMNMSMKKCITICKQDSLPVPVRQNNSFILAGKDGEFGQNIIKIRRVAETLMVSVRKRNIQGRYNSVRHLQRRYLNRIE